ncbi:hypothetical protein [Chryseobacterium indologenes]|uniref:hypothetical protein n=1 Tax=Chryseobacterium indologenes TaxID=253 RepID=UPI00148608D3|nr:hypothetical protein [Chryseobacterium indologenes]
MASRAATSPLSEVSRLQSKFKENDLIYQLKVMRLCVADICTQAFKPLKTE